MAVNPNTHNGLVSTIAQLEARLADKNSIITDKDLMLAVTSLRKKEATIQSLNDQLTKTRDYLTSTPQSLPFQLSYSSHSVAPVSMSGGRAVTIDGKVYCGGGVCVGNDEYCVYCYDPLQKNWSPLPILPVRWFGLGEFKGQLVVVGGLDSSGSISVVVRVYKEKEKIWSTTTIPSVPTARESPAVVSLSTHLVVAGGMDSSGGNNKVEIYNISTSQWSKTDKLPYSLLDPRGIVYKNTVYLMGKSDHNNNNKVCAAQVKKLISADRQDDGSANKADSVWNTISNTPSYRPSPVTISDTLFAVGGLDDVSETTQRIYSYSPPIDSWLYVGNLPSPIASAATATVSLSPTQCLMIGGYNNKREKQSTVHKISIK